MGKPLTHVEYPVDWGEIESVSILVGDRAENLFVSRVLMCSESVLTVLNQGLSGGLDSGLAISLVSGLPEGIGGARCTCGALSGGVIALGLLLGKNGGASRKKIRELARGLHDRFKDHFGATCCRVLTRGVKWGSSSHFERCGEKTNFAAKSVSGIILENRPEILKNLDRQYLLKRDTRLGGSLKRIFYN